MLRFTLWLFLIWLANCDNISSSAKTREISSVVNTVGQIPCPAEPFHDVAMILWFKDSSGTPIYSYDARSEKEEAKHMTLKNDWGLRLYFRVWPSSKRPPALIIRDLQVQDAGLYRCRVDFRNSPTTNAVNRLKVVQPPTHLEIRDTSQARPISDQQVRSREEKSYNLGRNDITFMGPYIEGQNISIVCSAYGGLPMPEVVWYWNDLMVDNSFELVENNYVTNELSITLLGGNQSHDLYTCQASNNNETKPISHRVNFDVYLTVKHIEVEIPDQMTAGVQYSLVCKAAGAYPTVKMEFWKIQQRIGPKHQIKSDADNVTTFVLPFKPDISDDESIITCRAENPWISQKFVETSRKLHVFYAPVVVLRFGSVKTTNFSEGESLLMECHVKANPAMHSARWFHEDEQILDDPIGGVRLSGMTLFIRHLSHFSRGRYWCEATNDIGKTASNILNVVLNIAPKCANAESTVRVSLALGNSHHLPCNVLAWPPDLNFYWTLNRSMEILPISSFGQTVWKGLKEEGNGNGIITKTKQDLNLSWMPMTVRRNGGSSGRKDVNSEATVRHQAVLLYQVKSDEDYGVVGCWAKNSYGKQIRPCLFQITPPMEEFSRELAAAFPSPEENLMEEKRQDGRSGIGSIEVEEDSWVVSGNGTFVSKLHGSLGIILMGLLIFITAGGVSFGILFLFCRRRRRRKMSKQPSPSILPTSPDMGNGEDCTIVHSSPSQAESSLNKSKSLAIECLVQVEGIRNSQALSASASHKSDQVFL